jgi:hypothetical protein
MGSSRAALIVAASAYDHTDLRQLAAPLEDAYALEGALGDREVGDFTVTVVADRPSHEVMHEIEDFFADRDSDDLLLLHFSGHGIKDAGGHLHLATVNTVPSRLASTSVDAAFLQGQMRRSRAGVALLTLDCCFGGAFERGWIARAGETVDVREQFADVRRGGKGRVVITASDAVQYAFEENDLRDDSKVQPSLFTRAFADGLTTGAADRDEDGIVTVAELYDHLHREVTRATPLQTPHKWEFGLEGVVQVARNPRRTIPVAPLPDHLVAHIASPDRTSRLGAAVELGDLAASDDLPVAAAARAALERMTADDSTRVRDRVADELSRSALRLRPDHIDVGELAVGEEPSRHVVGILGGALARSARVSVDHAAVRAHRVADEVVVEVDTSHPCRLDTTVDLEGPAGAARVHITGEVRVRTPRERGDDGPAPPPDPRPPVDARPTPGPPPRSIDSRPPPDPPPPHRDRHPVDPPPSDWPPPPTTPTAVSVRRRIKSAGVDFLLFLAVAYVTPALFGGSDTAYILAFYGALAAYLALVAITGSSPGHRVVGARLVEERRWDRRPSPRRTLLHVALAVLLAPTLLLLPYVVAHRRTDGRALHDVLSGTRLIDTDPA